MIESFGNQNVEIFILYNWIWAKRSNALPRSEYVEFGECEFYGCASFV